MIYNIFESNPSRPFNCTAGIAHLLHVGLIWRRMDGLQKFGKQGKLGVVQRRLSGGMCFTLIPFVDTDSIFITPFIKTLQQKNCTFQSWNRTCQTMCCCVEIDASNSGHFQEVARMFSELFVGWYPFHEYHFYIITTYSSCSNNIREKLIIANVHIFYTCDMGKVLEIVLYLQNIPAARKLLPADVKSVR